MIIPKGTNKIAAGPVGHQGKLHIGGPYEPVQAIKDDPVSPQGVHPEDLSLTDLPYPFSYNTNRIPGITGNMNSIILPWLFFEVPLDLSMDPGHVLPHGKRFGINNKEMFSFDLIFPV
jgi:hypothetical protein